MSFLCCRSVTLFRSSCKRSKQGRNRWSIAVTNKTPPSIEAKQVVSKQHRAINRPSDHHFKSQHQDNGSPFPSFLLRPRRRCMPVCDYRLSPYCLAHLGQVSSNSPCLLCSEIEGNVLLSFVELSEVGTLLGVDDSQNSSDGLANTIAVETTESQVSLLVSSFSHQISFF
jgi:hypothetical protein